MDLLHHHPSHPHHRRRRRGWSYRLQQQQEVLDARILVATLTEGDYWGIEAYHMPSILIASTLSDGIGEHRLGVRVSLVWFSFPLFNALLSLFLVIYFHSIPTLECAR